MMFHVNSSGLTVYSGLLRNLSVSSMRCSECQDRWYVFENHTEMVSPSQRLSRSGALTSACSLVHVERALWSSFSLVIALSVVTS